MVTKSSRTRVVHDLRMASGVSMWLDGYNLTVIAAVLVWAPVSLGIPKSGLSGVAAAVLVGALVGGLAAGWLTDRFGRRTIFAYDLVVFIVFALLSALSTSALMLIASRFLIGLAIGADYAISPAYMAEVAETKNRGYQMGYMWAFWSLGAVSALLLAAGVAVLLPPSAGWRVLLALPAIPAVFAMLLRQRIPESPRWLAANGQVEAGQELARAHDLEVFSVSNPTPPRTRAWRRWLLITVPWFFYDFAAYGLGLLLPFVLLDSGLTGTVPALLGSAAVDAVGFVGAVIGMLIIDHIGRRLLQTWGLVVPSLLLGGWLLDPHSGYVVFILVISAANALSQMGGLVTGVYPAEVFPTAQRATAMGVGTAVSRVGAVAGVFTLAVLQTHWGLPGVVAGAAIAALIAGASTLWLGIETKSRCLEDLAA